MDEINEEVYTTIFNALRHGVRRNILRMLNDHELNFSTMEEQLGLSSSHLTYHLDSLNELISKTNEGYKLSLFGKAAVDMIEKVEEPPRNPVSTSFNLKTISYILLAVTVLTSGLYSYSFFTNRSLQTEYNEQISLLEATSKQFDIIQPLYDLSRKYVYQRYGYGYASDFMITSSYKLYYYHEIANYPPKGTIRSDLTFHTRFYAPKPNLTLRMTPQKYYPLTEFSYPLTLQHGDAIRDWSNGVGIDYPGINNLYKRTFSAYLAPIIWQENVSSNNIIYITLPEAGWYSLCMTGPIGTDDNENIDFLGVMFEEVEGEIKLPSHLELWIFFSLLEDDEEVLFGVMDDFTYS